MYNRSIAWNTEYVKSECLYVFNCTITLTLSLALTLNSESPAKGTSIDSSCTKVHDHYLIPCVKAYRCRCPDKVILSKTFTLPV
jgi:hypothetical protein